MKGITTYNITLGQECRPRIAIYPRPTHSGVCLWGFFPFRSWAWLLRVQPLTRFAGTLRVHASGSETSGRISFSARPLSRGFPDEAWERSHVERANVGFVSGWFNRVSSWLEVGKIGTGCYSGAFRYSPPGDSAEAPKGPKRRMEDLDPFAEAFWENRIQLLEGASPVCF